MIDYDGIRYGMESALERAEAELVQAITDAMRDGEIPTCKIPFAWQICYWCDGNGGHSRRLGVIDPDDWSDEELDWYREGVYDATCERCNGTGKVREINEESLPDEVQEWITRYRDIVAEGEAIRYSERMMGC